MSCSCRSMAELEACECAEPVLEVVITGEPVGKERPEPRVVVRVWRIA